MMKEGVVIKATGSWYTVKSDDGLTSDCKLKGKYKIKEISATSPVVVGDRVSYDMSPDKSSGLITRIFPRKNYIVRKSKKLSKLSHVIAANIDNAIIIASLVSPRTSFGFIDRILFTCEAYHINSIIAFNKIDIYEEGHNKNLKDIKKNYEGIGYKCISLSALTGENISVLKEIMKGKINLLIGHSGVGKSAIINALQPGLNLKTGDISEAHDKGMHTTTFAEMHQLEFGGYIIDTPGVKEFGLIDFEKTEVGGYFPDIFAVMKGCKFKNCMHINEPGCAVKKAVEEGVINLTRYRSYLSIMNSDETEIAY